VKTTSSSGHSFLSSQERRCRLDADRLSNDRLSDDCLSSRKGNDRFDEFVCVAQSIGERCRRSFAIRILV